MKFPEYPKTTIELEEEILEKWRTENLFKKTLEQTEGNEEFVFFEGPPTANGKPGIHHVLARTLKDLIPRFQTMKGKHVTRIAGWDTHGLPVEIEAEKRLGISGKRQIEEVGVARFNEVCRESVFTYKEDWERLSERIGYWLDYSRPYITFSPEYIESIWWILKQFDDKGLIYKGYKSVPYCPRCGTALSSHEVAQGYEDVRDPSLYFIAPWENDSENRAFVVWTTTPWTLPSNIGLAVHPDLTYVEVEHEDRNLVLVESRATAIFGDDVVIKRRYAASDLVGQRYVAPFDIVPLPGERGNAWSVIAETFVTADDGTGIVHMAPAFGADDYSAGQKHNLPMLRPIDDAGKFLEGTPLVAGMFVKDADAVLLDDLRKRKLVFRYSLEEHSYPHCWRCSSPLIYMARDSWYIRTTQMKDVMIQNNNQVDWHPSEVGTGRFGEWLEGNIDWALSRERYWGTPLPIWLCDRSEGHKTFIGSFEELGRWAGGQVGRNFDPHKPQIDEVTWKCAQCEGTMRRTPEVIDVWFDSGSMPYAQWHYPFENKELFEKHFPAEYICEGVDQTRGWFYSMMAISSMLGHGPAYKHVIVNDLILDAEGQKMSKSRGNVVDPWTAINQFGVDAIRWYFITVSQPWVPKRFDPEALSESAHRVFNTLSNTYKLFALYANIEKWAAQTTGEYSLLDKWILSRLATTSKLVHDSYARYDVTPATRAIGEFIIDDVSNWYVRRSRDRFWGSATDPDTAAAFATLHTVLTTVARLLAPVTPFQADWLHRALTGESVHLAPFPTGDEFPRDERLEEGMNAIRELARLGRAARERMKIRVRQPLRKLQAFIPVRDISMDLIDVLKEELNVKEVHFLQRSEELVALRAQPNFRVLGKRFGAQTQEAAGRIRDLVSDALRQFREGEPLRIEVGGEIYELLSEEVDVREEPKGDMVVETEHGFTVALDPEIDEALRNEGIAREIVSRVQRIRRDSGLEVSDRIALTVVAEGDVLAAVREHQTYIGHETLAEEVSVTSEAHVSDALHDVELDGLTARIEVRKWNQQQKSQ
ncbi:MAG TPA: isoleucine--tRNA ligase [Longimicrobiales bacterium]|nr:isoleucine--tRNA ligase [Longimicrobiales bacterium]